MKKIASLCAAGAFLLLPAGALANNISQQGPIVKDDAASVKLRVHLEDGHPVKVSGFKALSVKARCDNGPSRIDLSALTPVAVGADNKFQVRLSDGHGGVFKINGKVKSHGTATVGNLKTNEFTSGEKGNKQTCRVSKQKFKTSA